MATLQKANLSQVQIDGKLSSIPGLDGTGQLMADRLPIFINSPVMTLHTAESTKGAFVAPCALEIVGIAANVIEAPGTAAGTIDVGTRADDDAFVAAYSFATDESTGYQALDMAAATVVSTTISQGDVVEFATNGEATTTGLIAVTLVCLPK